MKSTKNSIIMLVVLLLGVGCKDKMIYKHHEKPQLIVCAGVDTKLINEALYCFFDDITIYYREKSNLHDKGLSSFEAYANFIYNGALGTADYKNMASTHTLMVLDKLQDIKGLWAEGSDKSNLNYQNKLISCLLTNLKDSDIKTTILALRETNSLDPKILAERFRTSTREALEDPYYGMYIALDTYYQYLIDIDQFNESVDE